MTLSKKLTLPLASMAVLGLLAACSHSGNTGTWKEDEADSEKESKSVTVNPDNQSLTIGDDIKFYKLDGNKLTIEDDDRDPNDTIVLTK